jgi:hypothetical protein
MNALQNDGRKEEITPHEWKYGVICPIHKKGDNNVRNYRAVTLLYTIHNMLKNIVYVRLVLYTEEIIG